MPNIDSITKRGVAFTQFYEQARCCSQWATLMTVHWPHQVGVGAMIDGYVAKQLAAANGPAYDDHLNTASPTIPKIRRPGGYQTSMSGKWHLGYSRCSDILPQSSTDAAFSRGHSAAD